jgi:sugar phosphate isomerase/epimerase
MPARSHLGVCSWSLRATTPKELVERVRAVGVDCVQLALEPLRTKQWKLADLRAALREGGITVRSGMMSTHGEDYSTLDSIRRTGGLRPTEHWATNLEIAHGDAALASELGLRLVTFHAGFLPHDSKDPEHAVMLDRLRAIVDVFADFEIRVALETGQETAGTLFATLRELDRPHAGVNFDPANMILYGMGDPIAALRILGSRVAQMHVKDARKAKKAGAWGEEVAVGKGEVDWKKLFAALAAEKLNVDLMIEREAGEDRVGDISKARELVHAHWSTTAKP